MEYVCEEDVTVLNKGSQPTFVTTAKEALIENWKMKNRCETTVLSITLYKTR